MLWSVYRRVILPITSYLYILTTETGESPESKEDIDSSEALKY
jgi:hypothetical protein